jgi:hypothetical protein
VGVVPERGGDATIQALIPLNRIPSLDGLWVGARIKSETYCEVLTDIYMPETARTVLKSATFSHVHHFPSNERNSVEVDVLFLLREINLFTSSFIYFSPLASTWCNPRAQI